MESGHLSTKLNYSNLMKATSDIDLDQTCHGICIRFFSFVMTNGYGWL